MNYSICNMNESHRNNIEQGKPEIKGYILYDSMVRKFKNRQNKYVVIEVSEEVID